MDDSLTGPELDSSQFARPILILGMLQRTGTHYLFHLLQLHPDVAKREPWEDDLLGGAHHLDAYVASVTPPWSDRVPVGLVGHIGDGIVSWLGAGAEGKRVVTKFPDVANASRCIDLFPGASLLQLVRDGRSVAESAVRTWGSTYEYEAMKWANAARAVLRFQHEQAGVAQPRHRLVRYEDLLTQLEDELRAILRFCDLDPESYDFDAARALPLYGSSTPRGGVGRLHHDPVGRPPGFAGLSRWSGWDARRHRRFNAIAGDLLQALDYEPEDVGAPGPWLRVWALAYAAWFALIRSRLITELAHRRPFRSISWRLRQRRKTAALSRSAVS